MKTCQDQKQIFWTRTKDPRHFTKKKDESGPAGLICRSQVARVAACRLQVGPADRVRQHGQSEYSEGSYTSGSDEKTRLEISFHQPNKNMNILIQSDIYLQMAANGGIRENYHQQRQDIDHGSGGVLPRSQKPANSTPSTALCQNCLNNQNEVICLGLLECSVEFIIFSKNL